MGWQHRLLWLMAFRWLCVCACTPRPHPPGPQVGAWYLQGYWADVGASIGAFYKVGGRGSMGCTDAVLTATFVVGNRQAPVYVYLSAAARRSVLS